MDVPCVCVWVTESGPWVGAKGGSKGTYNWRHMPHGDAVGMSSALFFFCFWVGTFEQGGHEMMRRMYAPGGVMSVATANALKVRWPDVCQKASVSDWFSCLLYSCSIRAVEAWMGYLIFAGMRYEEQEKPM